MIRFPNPVSEKREIIRVFRILHQNLKDMSWFEIDHMSAVFAEFSLAASSGYIGAEALARSTRKDRSLDPIYNQAKMYAEMFRILGWMVSDSEKALLYRFTLLGRYIANINSDATMIYEQCVLGINYPNELLSVKGNESSRVFSTILRAANNLGGCISRDEIIVAVLNRNDDNPTLFNEIIDVIKRLRVGISYLSNELKSTADRLGIQTNTMKNYTRFVVSAMKSCGWFEESEQSMFYDKRVKMLKLTAYGQNRARELDDAVDMRLTHFKSLSPNEQDALIRLGFYSMLHRAGFDTTSFIDQMTIDRNLLSTEIHDREVIFSPYQTVRPEIVDRALGISQSKNHENKTQLGLPNEHEFQDSSKGKAVIELIHNLPRRDLELPDLAIGKEIDCLINKSGLTDKQIADKMFNQYGEADINIFYPLIADLFTVIGFDCKVSRKGVNSERWDAIAVDQTQSIPIEIKSPREEAYISIKAVRQAVENKVVLLSRESYKTDWETTSLVVGYNPPNARAEVSNLIVDFKKTFRVIIGVIDFYSLLLIASSSVRSGSNSYVEKIRKLEGVISVEDARAEEKKVCGNIRNLYPRSHFT